MLRKLVLIVLFISTLSFGQDNNIYSSEEKLSLLTGGFGYQYISPNSIGNSGYGGTASFGVNLASLITNKFSFAPYVSIKNREHFPQPKFNSNLSEYYKTNSTLNNLTSYEETVSRHFINQTSKRSELGGSARRQIGFQFYINKPYFPIIRVYRGNMTELIHTSDSITTYTGNSDWIYLKYKHWGTELLYLPFDKNRTDGLENVYASFFMEKNLYHKATLQGFNLSKFSPNFARDHDSDFRFGFKVGILFIRSDRPYHTVKSPKGMD